MGGLSPSAVEHAVPVVQIVVGLVVGTFAVIGAVWGGFVWLRARIVEEFHGLTKSDAFKKVVGEIIVEATHGWNDINNRQHEEHRRALAELRKRDDERADAIKRLHARVDSIWERMGGGR